MNTLPTKRDRVDPTNGEGAPAPSWSDLTQRFQDIMIDFMKEFVREGKALGRELEPKLLPALRRLKTEIEKLIARLEKGA